MKNQLKDNLAGIVAYLLFFTIGETMGIITNNLAISLIVAIIAPLIITQLLIKICKKNEVKIIEKGRKFWFYYLISSKYNLLEEESEICLVCWVNSGSQKHVEMLEAYLEGKYLCEKAEKLLKKEGKSA